MATFNRIIDTIGKAPLIRLQKLRRFPSRPLSTASWDLLASPRVPARSLAAGSSAAARSSDTRPV